MSRCSSYTRAQKRALWQLLTQGRAVMGAETRTALLRKHAITTIPGGRVMLTARAHMELRGLAMLRSRSARAAVGA